jgi:hypothetical protein
MRKITFTSAEKYKPPRQRSRRVKIRIAVVLGLTLVLAVPAAADAALPKPTSTLIVPGKSIGDVALGANAKSVQKAWGKTKECVEACVYEGGKNGDETPATASALLEEPASGGTLKVGRIFIKAGEKTVGSKIEPDLDTPLVEFKTSKGIGIGSSIGEVQRAYPSAKKRAQPGVTTFTLKGKGEIETIFIALGTKVTTVLISSHPGG